MEEFQKSFNITAITSTSALVADILFYPLELLMTQIKIHPTQTSFIQITKYIFKHEKISGLYRGLNTLYFESLFSNFGFFLPYELIKNSLYTYTSQKEKQHLKKYAPFLASFIAEACSILLYLPAQVVKTRMQSGIPRYKYKNFFHGYYQIAKSEGFLSFYRTSFFVIMHDQIFSTVFFGVYENTKMKLKKKLQKETLSNIEISMVAITTSFFTVLLTNFLDTLIRNYQVQVSVKEGIQKYCLNLYKKKGLLWFNRGFLINFIYVSMSSILIFPTYEFISNQYQDIK